MRCGAREGGVTRKVENGGTIPMPPAAKGSLSDATYAAIVAYVLEVNGSAAGSVELPADLTRLANWRVP